MIYTSTLIVTFEFCLLDIFIMPVNEYKTIFKGIQLSVSTLECFFDIIILP